MDAETALKLAPNRTVQEQAALGLALAGEIARAEKLAAALNRENPADTRVQRYWLPIIRAAIELQHKNADGAIKVLDTTTSFEFAPNLHPIYLRGWAYIALHNGIASALEFQKIVDHRGAVTNYLLGALAHLGLARAYALQGDTTKARAAYEEFLTLWKDADPDIPILQQAKAEYVRLK